MADLEFSRDDIVNLIEKISRLHRDFSDRELQLLTSIFALAAKHVTPVAEPETATPPEAVAPSQQAGDGPATVGELRQQLLHAYIPGSSFDSATEEVALFGIGRHHGLFALPQGIGRHHGIGRTAGTEPSPAAAESQPEPEEG
jgi:hypothetical protein